MGLVDQHEKNTNCQARIVIADHKYGTTENFVECQARGITTHMGDAGIKAHSGHDHTIFGDEAFAYDGMANIYRCPAGEILRPRRIHPCSPNDRVQGSRQSVCGMRVAPSMHLLFPWTHCAKTRKTSGPGCSADSSPQP